MSKRKIEAALKRKGIQAERIEYMRGCPTPTGYGNGWDIDLSEELEDRIYLADPKVEANQHIQFDTLSEVLDWIDSLPDLTNTGKDQ